MSGQGNGGPAFPRGRKSGRVLRGHEHAGLVRRTSGVLRFPVSCLALPDVSPADTAKEAYELADAMIEARKR